MHYYFHSTALAPEAESDGFEYFAFSPDQVIKASAKPIESISKTVTGTNAGDGIFLTNRFRMVQVIPARTAQAKVAPGAKVQSDL